MSEEAEPLDMTPGHFPFTLWRRADGEITGSGSATFSWALANYATEEVGVYAGAELDAQTHAFDIETGEPYERTRQLTPAELTVAINQERDRRLQNGKVFGEIYVTGNERDITNLTNLALGAQIRIGMGDNTATRFRDGNNVDHMLTPVEVLGLWQQASTYVSALYEASWTLKGMATIPQDFASDGYWP